MLRDLESDKIQFLTKRMMIDNRVGLKDVMMQFLCNDLSYEKTIELLIKVNSEMADSDQTIKLAGIYSTKTIILLNKSLSSIMRLLLSTVTTLMNRESVSSEHHASTLI